MKIYHAVQKLLVGTDRQTGDLISLLSFLKYTPQYTHYVGAELAQAV
jgi:hypothetical protein